MNTLISPYAWAGMKDRPGTTPLTADEIIDGVCQKYGMTRFALTRKVRRREIVQRRCLCWMLIKELPRRYSLIEMGQMLGGFDHTTVIHGLKTIAADLKQDEILRSDLEQIRLFIRPTIFLKPPTHI